MCVDIQMYVCVYVYTEIDVCGGVYRDMCVRVYTHARVEGEYTEIYAWVYRYVCLGWGYRGVHVCDRNVPSTGSVDF